MTIVEWRRCRIHADVNPDTMWGCPDCLATLRLRESSTRRALDNIYTIARREYRRLEVGKPMRPDMWAHVKRLCEEVGCQARTVGVLRDGEEAVP
jgi:hypothetical protein